MDPLDRLTRSVARTIGDGPDPRRRARQRRAVANLSVTPPFDRRWWWLVPLGAAVVLALAWVRPQPRPATLTALAQSPSAGAHFTASDQPLPVTFTDHSRLVLAPHASVKLTTLDPHRVDVDLERGQLDLSVTPDEHRAFSVSAGPFTVDVTGTAFTVDWLPESTTLTVAVTHGHVLVRGGSLGDGTRLSAGQRLTTTHANLTTSPTSDPHAQIPREPASTASEPQAAPGPAEPSPANHSEPADPGSSPRPPPSPGWRALADDGDHTAALAAAERAGFTALLERLDAADLERLAHSARLAGAAGPAHDVLQTLRRRFPADPRAATATFLLGRVALDLAHDKASAATWFTTYLRSDPHGQLASDARGRRLQILHDLGDVEAARDAATDYLQQHPNGARSDLARKILGTP